MNNTNFFNFYLSSKIYLDNNIKLMLHKKSELIQIINNVNFIIKFSQSNNLKPSDYIESLQQAKTQIEKYQLDINVLNKVSQNLAIDKNKYLSKSYNRNINLCKQHFKVLIGYVNKDNNVYNTIDKRQNIFKDSDYITFAYKLFLSHKINIKEFRNFKRYGIVSQNLRNHLYFKNNQNLKVSHKKHKLHSSKQERTEYIYIPKFNRLIRFKRFNKPINELIKDKLIYQEIALKRKYELDFRNLYSYSQL